METSIRERLSALFPPEYVEWRPGSMSKDKTRAQALAYINVRAVMHRLDEVLGVAGWQTRYVFLPNGVVECHLTCAFPPSVETEGPLWITKCDVGCEADQMHGTPEGVKSAVSDALKRAAVQFGIGRYLYDFPAQWVDWDENKRWFKTEPKLPDWAIANVKFPVKPADNAAQTISHDDATSLGELLVQMGWVTKDGKPDFSGILAFYCLTRLRDMTAKQLVECQRMVRVRDKLIAPIG